MFLKQASLQQNMPQTLHTVASTTELEKILSSSTATEHVRYGSLVDKCPDEGKQYLIDLNTIEQHFPFSGNFERDYWRIFHLFQGKSEKERLEATQKLFQGRNLVGLSESVRHKAGVCFETALLCTLAIDQDPRFDASYLARGRVQEERGSERHAFNIAQRADNKQWYLIDAAMPLCSNGRLQGFTKRIESIITTSSGSDIILADESAPRRYLLN